MLKRFFTEEKGQSATEYILIVSVIVGVVLVVGRVFKDQLQQIVGNVMGQVQKSAQSFMGGGGQ
ncbi:MAG: class III signal peptide-containing protein [Deltaproteobacteria bacterium]|nr:class III signal peptide-containing protein [Deltaproteobacteria bacterium]